MRDEIDVSELAQSSPGHTEQLSVPAPPQLQRFRLILLDSGAAVAPWESSGERLTIGSHPSNDVVLDDPTVSRFHCEVRVTPKGAWLRDLGSSNGTTLDGVRIGTACLRAGSVIRLGRMALSFAPVDSIAQVQHSHATRFGNLVGVSWPMRAAFFLLERAAATDVTVLIEGETGTGKEGAAESIHSQGARADKPFIVVDCGALPAQLLESELFGHERGAFTGATNARQGAFEAAHGGTLFLDEIGELPLDLQPKLLRVLEKREVRRLGANEYRAVDVRIVAATNRDLRALVNEGTFRSDVYYRLAVLRLTLPALRERVEDLPALVRCLAERLSIADALVAELLGKDMLERMSKAAWPGNVRELRNFVERCAVMQQPLPVDSAPHNGAAGLQVDASLTYAEAKRRILDDFEQQYLTALLRANDGNVSKAARIADLDRPYMYKLLYRHGLRAKG